jgi:GDP-4-dehydro-6-deoxy-D-mannose reductase
MKKILVTGANGFVGSHMVELLIKKKYKKIYATKRWHLSNLNNIQHLKNKLTFIDCDLTDPVSTANLVKSVKPEIIFHFAAESFVSPSWDHPHRYMNVNYNGTLNLLEAIRNHSPKTIIHLPGSGEEYGYVDPADIPISEKTQLKPVNPYAVTKIAQDLIGYVYYESYGVKVIRTRSFNHEGPRREKVFGIPWYAYQIALIEKKKQPPIIRVGHIADRRNFTHVQDMVEAYYISVKKCKPGELYLIGNSDKKSIYTFKEALKKLINMSNLKKVKIIEDKKYVRPTNVPRLIGDMRKFQKATSWKPKIGFNQILLDTLNYWRSKV